MEKIEKANEEFEILNKKQRYCQNEEVEMLKSALARTEEKQKEAIHRYKI